MINILYIHGMGGGGDSRIPAILRDALSDKDINIIVRTYDFDPEVAHRQIGSWLEETSPSLVIGESLGAVHTLRVKGIPHILISPSLNAPIYLGYLSWLCLLPGVTWIMDRIYKPKEGDRQQLHFKFSTLRKYIRHRREAMLNSASAGSSDYYFAFFGTMDHYRKSGIVSVRTWKKYFGDCFMMYDGTHFTEEEHIYGKVLPLICKVLGIKQ